MCELFEVHDENGQKVGYTCSRTNQHPIRVHNGLQTFEERQRLLRALAKNP